MSKATWQTLLALLRVAVKVPLPILVAVVGIFATLVLTKDCGGPNMDDYVAKAKYVAAVQEAAVEKSKLEARVAELTIANTAQLETIAVAEKKADVAGQDAKDKGIQAAKFKAETALLKHDAAAAIEANPALKRLVVNFELHIVSLEGQVFSLSRQVEEKDRVILSFKTLVVNKDEEILLLRKALAREEAIHDMCESLRLKAERRADSAELVAKLEAAVLVGVAVVVGGNALHIW